MKHIFLFLSLLFAVQIGQSQEVWNACNSTVTIIPAPSYDSTFVLSAPSRAALAKGMANWTPSTSGGGTSYLVYTALLTQSGTDAPVATVLQNTLGGTVVWTHEDVGMYYGTLTGAFTENKVFIQCLFYDQNSNDFVISRFTDDVIRIVSTSDTDYGSASPMYLEVRVYP